THRHANPDQYPPTTPETTIMTTDATDTINDHLARINTGLGPVDSIVADTDDQPAGVVRVYDDHEDALCDAAKLAKALADVGEGEWDRAWEVILGCQAITETMTTDATETRTEKTATM